MRLNELISISSRFFLVYAKTGQQNGFKIQKRKFSCLKGQGRAKGECDLRNMEDEYILDYSRIVFTKNNQPTKKGQKKNTTKKLCFQNTFTNMISTITIVDTGKTVIWMIFYLVENSLT